MKLVNQKGIGNMKTQLLIAAITTSALTGCGGGGDSSKKSSPEIQTGVFKDSPVAGLYYETETQSGLTNDLGEFNYIEGEAITFKLGATTLGVTQASELITPFSLSGVKPLVKQKEITNAFLSQSPNSFEKAINIATLLQGLDADGDESNGIDLENAHTQLASLSIPLLVKASAFENNAQYTEARNTMLRSHSLRFVDAAKNMYDSIGITIESNLTARQTSNINNAFFETIDFEYDDEGRVSLLKFDKNNDGEIDTTQSFTYDSAGRVHTIFNSANNTTQTLTYDDNNRLISRITVDESSMSTDESFVYTNERLERFSIDTSSDGTSDFNTTYNYNTDNILTGYEIDSDGDDLADKTVNLSVQNGKVQRFTESTPDSTSLDIAYAYNANGKIKSQNIQSADNDATPFTNAKFSYDGANNLQRYELDKDLDGKPDYIESYKYNQNKQRTQYRRDDNADGRWDFMAQYFYDVNGNRIRMLEDSDGNGVVDKTWEADIQPAILESTWDDIANTL